MVTLASPTEPSSGMSQKRSVVNLVLGAIALAVALVPALGTIVPFSVAGACAGHVAAASLRDLYVAGGLGLVPLAVAVGAISSCRTRAGLALAIIAVVVAALGLVYAPAELFMLMASDSC